MILMVKGGISSIWLRAIGYMLVPLLIAPLFFYLAYPLKPHCAIGQGKHGCTPLCQATGYFKDGRPSGYKVTPCYHEEYPMGLQKVIYENRTIIYPILLVGVILLLFKLHKQKMLMRIAFAPYYFFQENKKNKNILVRLLFFTFLLLPFTIEWAVGYAVVIGTLLNETNLF